METLRTGGTYYYICRCCHARVQVAYNGYCENCRRGWWSRLSRSFRLRRARNKQR